jgi:hypothetical protein
LSPQTCYPHHRIKANADTGSSGHYIAVRDLSVILDIQPTLKPIHVMLPDGSSVTSTHTGKLNWPQIPEQARLVHVFPTFSGSLISIGILCDCGLTVTYDKEKVVIKDANNIVMSGQRDPISRLWMLDLDSVSYSSANPSIDTVAAAVMIPPIVKTGTSTSTGLAISSKIVAFNHAAMFSPTISTLLEAIRRGFVDLPGLTTELVSSHPPVSIATAKGHLDQVRQGQQSTRTIETYDELLEDWYPVPKTKQRGPVAIAPPQVHAPTCK